MKTRHIYVWSGSLCPAGLSSLKHHLAGKGTTGILPGFLGTDELLHASGCRSVI